MHHVVAEPGVRKPARDEDYPKPNLLPGKAADILMADHIPGIGQSLPGAGSIGLG